MNGKLIFRAKPESLVKGLLVECLKATEKVTNAHVRSNTIFTLKQRTNDHARLKNIDPTMSFLFHFFETHESQNRSKGRSMFGVAIVVKLYVFFNLILFALLLVR